MTNSLYFMSILIITGTMMLSMWYITVDMFKKGILVKEQFYRMMFGIFLGATIGIFIFAIIQHFN